MAETCGGYLEPVSGRLILIGRPASQPRLWKQYTDGARRTYRRHGVGYALDYEKMRDGTSTAVFFAVVDTDGSVIGGLRVQGPYTDVAQASAIEEWAGRSGTEELGRQIAERLADGVIEVKSVWVDADAACHHEISDALARAFVHSLKLTGVRHALCTAATHAIPRWESTGGVVSADVTPVAYPDERYETRPMWWDRHRLLESIARRQRHPLAVESRLLPSGLITAPTGSPSAAA